MYVYRAPGSGRLIRSQEPLEDSALEAAFQGVPLPAEPETAMGRAGSYLMKQAGQFVEAGQSVLGDIMGQEFPEKRTTGQRIADIATVATPVAAVAAPVSMGIPVAAGLAAGTVGRGAGMTQEDADLLNAATQMGVGGIQGVRGVFGAKARASRELGRITQQAIASGARVAPASEAGQQLYTVLAKQRPMLAGAERKAAKVVLDALETDAGPSYELLDDAYFHLKKVGPIRGAINRAMGAALQGMPEGQARTAAKAAWKLAIQPSKNPAWYQRPVLPGLVRGVVPGPVAGLSKFSPGQLALGARAGGGGVLAGAASAVRALENPARDDYAPETPTASRMPAEAAPATAGVRVPARRAVQPVAGPYGREIAAAASVVDIPPRLLQIVMRQESGGDPTAVSRPEPGQAQTPAHGLMQITPGTFAQVAGKTSKLLGRTAQLENPLDNIVASAVLWRRYLDLSDGNLTQAAHMYFGGENPRGWGRRTAQYGQDISRQWLAGAPAPARTSRPAPAEDEWSRNLDERVRLGYLTPEQAAAAR